MKNNSKQQPQKHTIEELAAEQGVTVLKNINDLKANFWPEQEGPQDFEKALSRWRDETPPNLEGKKQA